MKRKKPEQPPTMLPTLNELKGYLRVDGDYDDDLISMLILAAASYLKNAGIIASDDPLYRLAVMLYVAVHYENRDGSQKMNGFSHAFQSIILQLKAGSL